MRPFNITLLGLFPLALLILLTACEKPNVVATVGTEKITVDELRDAFRTKAQLMGVNSISAETKREVLELLIQRAMVHQYAGEQGMKVSEEKFQELTRSMSDEEKKEKLQAITKYLLAEQVKSELTKDVVVAPGEVNQYYQDHEKDFMVPDLYKVYLVKVGKENADHVLKQVKKDPEAFDDMALNTETPELKQINKNAPFTALEGFPEGMGALLKKMKKGDIAGPVDAARGLFLFKLVDKEKAHVLPLSDISAQIEQKLLQQKRNEKFEKWYEQEKEKYPVKVLIKDIEALDG